VCRFVSDICFSVREGFINKKIALTVFYFGLLVLCLGAIFLVSTLLNIAGYEFKSFFRIGMSNETKLIAGIPMFIIGMIIMRLAAKPAGKFDETSSFKDRLKKNLRS
jgi:hypothetical protein